MAVLQVSFTCLQLINMHTNAYKKGAIYIYIFTFFGFGLAIVSMAEMASMYDLVSMIEGAC